MPPDNSAPVVAARTLVRNWTIGTIAASLSILPAVLVSELAHLDPGWALGGFLGVMVVGAALTPWKRLHEAGLLLRAYDHQQGATALLAASPPRLAEGHPLADMARRVRALGADDDRIAPLVDGLEARLHGLHQDLGSLREAVALEEGAGAAVDDPRLLRLRQALAGKEAGEQRLTGALRDLHVELTLRQDADHEALYGEIEDLLAGLSAQAEVDALAGESAEDRRLRALQAQKARGEHR